MALKPKQIKLAELMVLEPELNNEQYAERVKINPSTVYAWKKNKEFQDYLHSCCQEEFKSLEKLAVRKLRENAAKGNQKAIEYLLNYIGYKAPEEVIVKDKTIKVEIEE